MRGTGEGSQMMMESRVKFQKYAFESSQLLLLRTHMTFGTSLIMGGGLIEISMHALRGGRHTKLDVLEHSTTEGVIISCHQTGNQLPLWGPVIFLPNTHCYVIFWEMLSYHWSRWTVRSSFSLLSSSPLRKTSTVSNSQLDQWPYR